MPAGHFDFFKSVANKSKPFCFEEYIQYYAYY